MEDERAGKEDGKWQEQDRLQQASVLGFSRYLRGSHAMLASRVLESFARNEEKRPLVECNAQSPAGKRRTRDESGAGMNEVIERNSTMG